MIADEHIDLVQRVLDEAASPEEKARLEELMQADPAIRAYYKEQQHLHGFIRAAQEVRPSGELKSRVMAAVSERTEAPAEPVETPRREETFWDRLARIFENLVPHSPGVAFAGGLGVGLAALLLVVAVQFNDAGFDSSQMSGTIGQITSPESIEQSEVWTIEHSSVNGTVTTNTGNTGIHLALDLQAAQPTPVTIIYAPSEWAVIGYFQATGETTTIEGTRGQVQLAVSGANQYVIMLRRVTQDAQAPRVVIGDGADMVVHTVKLSD